MKLFPVRTVLLLFLLMVVVVATFLLFEKNITELMHKGVGYADGNFTLTALVLYLVLASDILLPVPSCLASSLCGILLGGWFGFLISFLAMSTSSVIGYWIGRKSNRLAARFLGREEAVFLETLHKKAGTVFLLVLRPVPVLAETSLVFAGIAGMPLKKTFLAVSAGNAAVSAVYAFAGACLRSSEEYTGLVFGICLLLTLAFTGIPYILGKVCKR